MVDFSLGKNRGYRKVVRTSLLEAAQADNKADGRNGTEDENEELHGLHSLPIVLQDSEPLMGVSWFADVMVVFSWLVKLPSPR
ncbi:MAG: hypothetical protein WCJ49_07840 [Deltaproteobacteria bacterium]